MKKSLFLVSLLLTVVMAFAAKEDNYLLYANFETGVMPDGWTQEHVSGNVNWVIESGATAVYPTGAHNGSAYRLAIRNQNRQTDHFVTRLITPVMNLNNVVKPILVFSHAQPQWTGDVDELRIYYRSTTDGKWVLLEEYTQNISLWRTDTVLLTAVTATYQLAFEMTDKLGRGVVMDDIIVRPTPSCTEPSGILLSTLTVNSAGFKWQGSFDTDSFNIVISEKKLTNMDDLSEAVLNTTTENFEYTTDSILKQNTAYYLYLRANCQSDASEWVEFPFVTKNVINLPYTENFDTRYATHTFTRAEYWSYGTNILNSDNEVAYLPFINQGTVDWMNYSYSGSSCMTFAGDNDCTTEIPANYYVYAATPELAISNMSTVEVSFWGTAYNHIHTGCAASLIVGVMTDPVDLKTFVPVDTVTITRSKIFERFTVHFDDYKGDGKFIGFVSNFDKRNIFFMDDLTIRSAQAKMPSDVKVSNLTSKGFEVNANLNGATGYKIYVTKVVKEKNSTIALDPTTFAASDYIVSPISGTALPAKVTLPDGMTDQFVEVYVVGTKDGQNSAAALPVKIIVPTTFDGVPYFAGFEDNEPSWQSNDLIDFSHSVDVIKYPKGIITTCSSYNVWPKRVNLAYNSNNAVCLSKELQLYSSGEVRYSQPYGDYIALPEVENAKDVMVQFYMNGYANNANIHSSKVAVGIMTDPLDPATFEAVEYCENAGAEYKPFIVRFDNYTGKGHYPAIMAVDATHRYNYGTVTDNDFYYSYTITKTSIQNIDAITLQKNNDCVMATDLKATVTDVQATISWKGNGGTKWETRIYADKACTDSVTSNITTTPTCQINDLKPHTTYWYKVMTVCSDGSSVESTVSNFVTACAAAESIPYVEDFEVYTGGNTSGEQPYCWSIDEKVVSGNTYPYIITNVGNGGKKSYSFTYPTATVNAHLSLPKMSKPLNQLQITFFARVSGSNYGDTVTVGILTNLQDLGTFEPIAKVRIKGNSFDEYIVRFDHAKATNGYITFMRSADANAGIYIDDIRVDDCSACEKIQGVSVNNFTTNGGTVSWTKGDATKWQVVVTSKQMALENEVVVDNTDILSSTETSTMPFVINNCPDANVTYYVYVRSLCSDTEKGAWSNVVSFKTTCSALEFNNENVIDFSNANELDCWSVGIRQGTAAASALPKIASGALSISNTKTTDGAYAVMPPLKVDDISKYQISFLAHGGTNTTAVKKLKVGIITNIEDFATFNEMATLDLNLVSAVTAWGEALRYTVRFDKYTGDYNGDRSTRVIFYSESGDNANYIYIDNINFDTLATCQAPTNIYVKDVSHESADLTWENIADKYQVQILNAKNIVEKDTVVNTAGIHIEGLVSLQTYVAQVRTICSAKDTSDWMQSVHFTTSCPPVFPLPYFEDFNYTINKRSNIFALPGCWTVWYNKLDGLTQTYGHILDTPVKEGIGSLNMASTYSATAPKSTWGILPKLEGKISDMMVSFDCYGINTYEATIAIGATNEHDDIKLIDGNIEWITTIPIAKGTAWNHYTANLSDYTGDAQYLVIGAINGNGKNSIVAQVYIDNLLVEKAPTCKRPTNMKITTASANSATISWTPSGSETEWDVAYGTTNTPVDQMTVVSADTTVATIKDLQSNTSYEIYVRSKCSATDISEWAGPTMVQTGCIVDAHDLSWTFDNTDVNVPIYYINNSLFTLPQCWYSYNNSSVDATDYVPMIMPNTSRTSTNVLFGYDGSMRSLMLRSKPGNNGAYAVLPEMDVKLDTMQIRFQATASSINSLSAGTLYTAYAGDGYAHSVKVGYMTDPYDYATFVELADFTFPVPASSTIVDGNVNAHWNEYTVSLYGVKGKYIAFASDYSLENYIYVDNVVVEREASKPVPTNVKVDVTTLSDSHADISWTSSQSKWRVLLQKDGVTVATELVEKSAVSFNNLTPNTTYTVKVQCVYQDGDSEWATSTFTTRCTPAIIGGASWNFEENLYQYGAGAAYLIPSCWTVGSTMEGVAQQYIPYAIANTASNIYAHSNHTLGQHALQFYATITAYGGYAIMPPVEVEKPDSTELHFFYRATYIQNNLMVANENYDKKLIVGYVLYDDITTFVPVDTVEYSFITTASHAPGDAADEWWQEAILPMTEYAGAGRRIAFKYCGTQPKMAGRYYIDDIEVRPLTVCRNLSGLRVSNTQSRAAEIVWNTVEKDVIQLQIAADANFENIMVDTTLTQGETSYTIDHLNPGTAYYVQGRRYCEKEITDWVNANFTTTFEPRFAEDFSADLNIPNGWSVLAGSIEAALNKTGVMTPTTSPHAFARDPQRGDIRVYTGETQGALSMTEAYWLNTPKIDLTNYTKDSLILSFDVYLTNKDGYAPNTPSASDKFAVAISTDGGLTWERQNATIWSSDQSATYPYTNLTGTPTKICIDITNTAGNVIVVGFSHYAYVTYSQNYLHIDNVQLNTCHIHEYAGTVCEWNDYDDGIIYVPADQLTLGENHIEKYVPAKKNGEADNYYKATVTVTPIVTTTQEATVCEGENYMRDGFNITNITSSATYKQKLTGSNTCDSIVVLNVTVKPTLRSTIEDSICQGSYYEFNGKKYYNAVVVSDTLRASTGCDSIVTLFLTVRSLVIGNEETVYLCPGASYAFGKYGQIEAEGTYVDTFRTATGCDSIAKVTIIRANSSNTLIRAAICSGDVYNNGSFTGLRTAGDYKVQAQTIHGCDSVVTLHLLVAGGGNMTDNIKVSELPYVINGEELLPVGTAVGTYNKTITLPCGAKTITIVVNDGTGLENLTMYGLSVIPNPVGVGEEAMIQTGFTGAQMNGMTVEVFNSVGMLVHRAMPNATPIIIPGMPTAGVYMVRITTADAVYQTKLIVK